MNRAVFLDRDGTINVDKGDIWLIKDFEFIPGAVDALRELHQNGYKLVVITNQGKIGKGLCTAKDVEKLNSYMVNLLKKEGIEIAGIYVCPHHPDDGCSCRKPEAGSIKKAIVELGINAGKSFMIGDKTSDIKAGETAGCKTILVKTGHAGKDGRANVTPNFIAKDLYGTVKWISKQR